ncbi:MAG: class I SAM-dependent methyltransferase [Actinomycetota bacterium]|nr:class I SAM-dependent methyltransferase [Actinomycetota bacterium]
MGVHEGDSLRLVRSGTRAVGIDPGPDVRHRLGPDTTVVEATSDEVLAGTTVPDLLGGLPIDLAFIDGMHLFEYALRDFIGLERWCAPGATILVHDCLPLDAETSARERSSVFWSGDVWKLPVCLAEHRPALDWRTVDVEPTGLAVIRALDPTSTTLSDRYEEICERYLPLGYEAIGDDKGSRLRLVPGDWESIAGWL